MKRIFLVLMLASLFLSCVEHKNKNAALPSDSIFNLTSSWQNQSGDTLQLKQLRGKTLVVVMIYTSCKTACPMLVANMKNIEKKISPAKLGKTSLILVSIDPETDTPKRLKAFALANNMNAPHWIFLRSDEKSTQEFANVLSMKYKKISPIDFSHSNIISVFSPDGQLVSQEEGTNIETDRVAETVNKTVAEN